MVKKKMLDGSDCPKCGEVTDTLRNRGYWTHIDDVVWALEGDASSPGMQLGARLGVDRAPFFVVRDGATEAVYTSVLQLIRERFDQPVAALERAQEVDVDDIGI